MRVDVQDDGVVYDVSVRATDLVSEVNDCVSHLLEVGELLASQLLRELGPRLGAFSLMVETKL